MDEDSDDFYQVLLKNFRIFSSVFWSFPFTVVSKIMSGQGLFRTSKLEISISIIGFVTFLLILYQSVELLRRFVPHLFPTRLKRSILIGTVPFPSRDTWELKKGNCSVYAMKGRRPKMEDRFSVISDKETGIALYGVFDGHGGEFAAEFAEKHLFKNLLKKLQEVVKENKKGSSLTTEFVELLGQGILDIDVELLVKVKASKNVAGTTALVAIVYENQLIVANVGDSRGVICDSKGNTIPLSFDHKPDQLKERRRIHNAGGFIAYNGVWRVAGILATSRALGDFPLKDRNLVIARPDILTFDLNDLRPRFMILATDGLWDIFNNEDAVTFVKNDVGTAAKTLALQAHKNGSTDNITVMVVEFPELYQQ